jgi:DNA polymerase-3 subunit epsilon
MHNSLDALCKRFKVSLAERDKHGALIDARLLADVYLELRGGRETALDLTTVQSRQIRGAGARAVYGPRPKPLAARLSAADLDAHRQFVAAEMKDKAIWFELDS